MPRQNQQADLVKTLADTDARLRKLERQMAVQRKGDSSITAETSTTSLVFQVLTLDSVTVVTTATCLIHFYAEFSMKVTDGGTGLGGGIVVLVDRETNNNTNLASSGATSGYETWASAPGSVTAGGTTNYPDRARVDQNPDSSSYRRVTGGGLTIAPDPSWASASGPHTFSLGMYVTNAANTIYLKNRKLYAWVQTF